MISRMPHLTIAQPGIHVTRSRGVREQRVWHMVERLRQPTRQCLPWCASYRPYDSSLSILFAVSFQRAGSNRSIPHFWMVRVSSNSPPVVPVKTLPRLRPGRTSIPADGNARAAAAAFIDPVSMRDMEGERVAIAQRPPAMPAPCLPAIEALHHCSSLDAHQDDLGVRGRERNRLHIGAKGFLRGREPEPARTNAPERGQFHPTR